MARLDEIFNLQMGKTPSRNNTGYWIEGKYDWISIADLSTYSKYTGTTKERISEVAVQESGIKRVPENTVIMSFKLSLGKTAITKESIYTNEAIMAFIPTGKYAVLPDYFYHLFSTMNWSKGTNRAVMGTTLNKATLGAISIIVPPLSEQRKIAAVLDKVSDLITKHRQQLDKLDELVKSRFIEIFGDLKSNPRGWPVVPFSEFAKIDGNMTTDYEKYADYPHIGIDSIEKGTGELKGYRTVREDGVISGKYIFTPQHIIYSKIRPNLNKVALPDFYGVCSADAYPILPNRLNCNRVFLAAVMR